MIPVAACGVNKLVKYYLSREISVWKGVFSPFLEAFKARLNGVYWKVSLPMAR